MVSRVRDAIRRLIEDYGSDDEKTSPPSTKSTSKKTGQQKAVFRNKPLQPQASLEGASSLSSNSSEDEPLRHSPSIKVPTCNNNSDRTDEEADEDQRVRQFPHVAGQWSTFIYFIPRIDGLSTLLHDLLTVASSHSSRYKWTPVEEPHVSLSRTVTLRYHEVPSFTAHLKAEIVKSGSTRFTYKFEEVAMFYNDSSSTSFLALKVGLGGEEMGALLKTIDSCLKCFKLEPFYDHPEFHVSFAWCGGRVVDEDRLALTTALQKHMDGGSSHVAGDLMQTAKALHCKSGNRTYLIPL